MRYAIVTAFLAFGLAGCNLNGINFDVTGLPSLEVNGNCQNNPPRDGGGNCRLVWKNADDQGKPPVVDPQDDGDEPGDPPSLPEPQSSTVKIAAETYGGDARGPTGSTLKTGGAVYTEDISIPYNLPYSRVNDENDSGVPDVKLKYYANEANDEFKLSVIGPPILWRTLPSGDIHYRGSDLFIREPDGTSGIKGAVTGMANFDDMMANVKLEAPNLKIDARNMAISGETFHFSSGSSGDVDLTRNGWKYETRDGWNDEGLYYWADKMNRNKIIIGGQFHGAAEAISGSFRVFDGTVGIFTADKVVPETN